jgi:hypothetical protein
MHDDTRRGQREHRVEVRVDVTYHPDELHRS